MTTLIFFFCISIVFSFLCSVWEATLLSITPSYVQVLKDQGGKVGHLIERFKEDIDRPLSAILTLNTIAHTVGAIGVGAQAEKIFPSESGLAVFGYQIGTSAIIATLMTLAILILSEIIPKTIGANYWKQLTGFTVHSVNFIIKLLYPLVWVSQFITKTLKNDKDRSVFNRADFSVMADIAQQDGVFQKEESRILKNLVRFDTIQTEDIMTPRTVVHMANQDQSIRDFREQNRELTFSRIPIYDTNRDDVTGFVLKDEILEEIIEEHGDQPLRSIRRELMVVANDVPLPDLFMKLVTEKAHIAQVVGEYGGLAGIVTIEDVIETLLGLEIVDEMDSSTDMQKLARANWKKRAKKLGIVTVEEAKVEVDDLQAQERMKESDA